MKVAEYKQGGPSFFIPVNDDFCKDMMPVNQQEDEEFEQGNHEAAKFAAWMDVQAQQWLDEYEKWK